MPSPDLPQAFRHPSTTLKFLLLIPLALLVSACSSTGPIQPSPLIATKQLVDNTSTTAGNNKFIAQLYESRTWIPHRNLSGNPIELGKNATIPVQKEGVKLLGPSDEDALHSLSAKIWMIENARHTIDTVY